MNTNYQLNMFNLQQIVYKFVRFVWKECSQTRYLLCNASAIIWNHLLRNKFQFYIKLILLPPELFEICAILLLQLKTTKKFKASFDHKNV